MNYNLIANMCCCAQLREKRAKKKERKMAAGTEAGNGRDEMECAIVTKTPAAEGLKEESENRGEQGTATKRRPKKASQYTKQSKTKSMPPPLRNRGKRRMQPWMWILLTTLVVLALFFVGQQQLLY